MKRSNGICFFDLVLKKFGKGFFKMCGNPGVEFRPNATRVFYVVNGTKVFQESFRTVICKARKDVSLTDGDYDVAGRNNGLFVSARLALY